MKTIASILLIFILGINAQAGGISATNKDSENSEHGIERGLVNYNGFENSLDPALKAKVSEIITARCTLENASSIKVEDLVIRSEGPATSSTGSIFVFTILIERDFANSETRSQKVRVILHKNDLSDEYREDFVVDAADSGICF